MADIALKCAELPKENKSRSRVVVFTQGANDTILVYEGKVHRVPVPAIPAEKIVDTNGAGDGACVCAHNEEGTY